MKNKIVPVDFFQSEDTLRISRNLLGKILLSSIDNVVTSGMIVETEAYLGKEDRACHAFGGRRSKRTEVMYLPGGHLYVYLCYGIHSLLNITTHEAEVPHAILIRALQPLEGIEMMLQRRNMKALEYRLTSGPGSLSVAMGITTQLSGSSLGEKVWVEDQGVYLKEDQISASPRIGVQYAKEDAFLLYRFQIKDNPWVSK